LLISLYAGARGGKGLRGGEGVRQCVGFNGSAYLLVEKREGRGETNGKKRERGGGEGRVPLRSSPVSG